MKRIFLVTMVIVITAACNALTAQTVSMITGEKEIILSKDASAKITSFSGKYNAGKVYLKWTVANQHADGVYIIYRSTDGVNYEAISQKQGIGVAISQGIAYYFTDESPCNEIAYYKLVHISENKKLQKG